MYQCSWGPRNLVNRTIEPCTETCQCAAGQAGCGSNDKACRNDLVCEENFCKAADVSIVSVSSTYSSGDDITLTFENPAGDHIWIAIWAAVADPRNLQARTTTWVWPCGNKSCDNQWLTVGTVQLSGVSNGIWKAFVMVDMHRPYEAIASSNSFSVGGGACEDTGDLFKVDNTTKQGCEWLGEEQSRIETYCKGLTRAEICPATCRADQCQLED
jgi:hypothetical protein